jgi:drug/metabolite transporter (DMT)-like permease
MPPAVVAAVLFSALLHAVWNGLLRQSSDRQWTAVWIGISTFIVCAPLLPLVGFPSRVWPFVLASSVLHVVYLHLLALAYKESELSFAYPIARGSSPMLVALGGLLVASERPSPLQTAGIVAIAAGIAAVGLASKHWDKRGFMIAMSIGLVIAIYTVLDAMGARISGAPLQYNVCDFSLYGCMILVLQLARGGLRSLAGPRKEIALAFGGGATSAVAYGIVTWAMVRAPMGTVSALRETSTLFAAGIGVLLLKERSSTQKMLGCAGIAAGAALIGLG